MPSCSVKWCSNHTSTCSLKLKNGVSFHRFPKDEIIRQKWVEAVRHERRDPWWTSSNASRICSLHFKKSDISATPCKVNVLAKTAVPICTMVWCDDIENNIITKTSVDNTTSSRKILKTYERKKPNVNVLKESKVNRLEEEMSLRSSEIANLNEVQKKYVLTDLNQKDNVKCNKGTCCKLKINDNTSFILDEDLSNETDTMKVTFKEIESNENLQEVINKTKTDMLIETIANVNGELHSNMSNNCKYLGEIKTYRSKGKVKTEKKTIECKTLTENKGIWSITENGSNSVKCEEINNTNMNIYPTEDSIKELNTGACLECGKKMDENKTAAGLEPNKDAKKELNKDDIDEFIINQSNIDNIKGKDTTKFDEIILELFESSKSGENVSNILSNNCQKSNEDMIVKSNTISCTNNNMNNENNVIHAILDLDTNNCAELNSPVHLEFCRQVNVELTDAMKTEVNTDKMVINQSVTQSNKHTQTHLNGKTYNCPESDNENTITIKKPEIKSKMISDIYIECEKISAKDTTELNKINNVELYNEINIGLNDEVNTKITDINEDFTQFNENTLFQNKMNSDANKETELNDTRSKLINSILLEKFVINMSPESKNNENVGFNKEINKDLDAITETEFNKDITDREECTECNEHTIRDPHHHLEMITSLQNNIHTDATKDTPSNVTTSKDISSILLEQFINNLSPGYNSRNTEFINSSNTDPNATNPIINKKNISDNEIECNKDFVNNTDAAAEFDLSLLLGNTPKPDKVIQSVDNNSKNNILNAMEGSSNWIHLAADEMPKIIDDVLDHRPDDTIDRHYFENLNLLNEKTNKLKLDNVSDKYDIEILKGLPEFLREHNDVDDIINLNEKDLNSFDTLEVNKINYGNKSVRQTRQPSVHKLARTTLEESHQKSKIEKQGTFKSEIQEINNEPSEGLFKQIEEVNTITNEEKPENKKSESQLNNEKLKTVIFEECYDPECGNNCKNKKHNSLTQLYNKNDEIYTRKNTHQQSDITKPKVRFNILYKQFNGPHHSNNKRLIENRQTSDNDKYVTKYKKIAIDQISGKYIELRWRESDENFNSSRQEDCKRKHKEFGFEQRKMRCLESTSKHSKHLTTERRDYNCENQNGNSSQLVAECPECGYTTDDNDLVNYKNDVDLRISKPLSLINKDMFLSHNYVETENIKQNNGNNKRVALESVYAMELAYATAIQALERKLKQKIAISEYRQRRMDSLSKINSQLLEANTLLMNIAGANKV